DRALCDVEYLLAPAREHDVGTLLDEPRGGCAADTPAAAGDEDGLAFEVVRGHGLLLRGCGRSGDADAGRFGPQGDVALTREPVGVVVEAAGEAPARAVAEVAVGG